MLTDNTVSNPKMHTICIQRHGADMIYTMYIVHVMSTHTRTIVVILCTLRCQCTCSYTTSPSVGCGGGGMGGGTCDVAVSIVTTSY